MQHPNERFLDDPMFATLRRWVGPDQLAKVPSLEQTIAAMDAAGVRWGLLSAWHGPRGPLISNDEVAAQIAAYPERLTGLASVDLYRPMDAVRELRRSVQDLGFRGLRILPWLWNLPPNDRRYYPLFAACVELKVPFFTQVGHTGPLCPSEPGRPIPYLDEVLLEFPELTIVAGHVGFPWVDEVIALCRKYPNFHVDTSAYKLSRLPGPFVDYMRESNARNILFGSNYPMLLPLSCLDAIDSLGLSEAARRAFLSENAIRLLGLPT